MIVTQVLAYQSVDLKGRQLDTIRAMIDLSRAGVPLSRENIARQAGMKESSACGRIKELRDKGIVAIDSFTKGSSGKDVETYKLVEKGQNTLNI